MAYPPDVLVRVIIRPPVRPVVVRARITSPLAVVSDSYLGGFASGRRLRYSDEKQFVWWTPGSCVYLLTHDWYGTNGLWMRNARTGGTVWQDTNFGEGSINWNNWFLKGVFGTPDGGFILYNSSDAFSLRKYTTAAAPVWAYINTDLDDDFYFRGHAEIDNGVLYAGTYTRENGTTGGTREVKVVAVDTSDGSEVWAVTHDMPTPSVDTDANQGLHVSARNGVVWLTFGEQIMALDASDGSVTATTQVDAMSGESDQTLISASYSGGLVTLTQRTVGGTQSWVLRRYALSGSSITQDAATVLSLGADETFLTYQGQMSGSTWVLAGGVTEVGSPDWRQAVLSIDVLEQSQKWFNDSVVFDDTDAFGHYSVAVHGGIVYAGPFADVDSEVYRYWLPDGSMLPDGLLPMPSFSGVVVGIVTPPAPCLGLAPPDPGPGEIM